MADIKAITEKLEQGVRDVFSSDNYKAYLDCMGRFHRYSFNNCVLIFMQMPSATLVAGYQSLAKNFNRHVRKGETAIKILAPIQHKARKEVVLDDGTTEEKELRWTSFRAVNVFDISQTEGDEIPSIPVHELNGEWGDFSKLFDRLVSIAPVPVAMEQVDGSSHGYFHHIEKRIAIKEGMSQQQTIKTLIHEIAHSILHDKETGEEYEASRGTKEVQAESVAYTVCSALGLDTSDYSLFNCIVYDVEHEYTVLISDWFGEKTYHTKDRTRAEEAAETAVYNGRACYSCVTDESGDMICEFEGV